MLDIRAIRSDPEAVKASLARRGIDTSDIDAVVALDARRRDLVTTRDAVRAEIKTLSKQVGRLRGTGDESAAEASMARSRALGAEADALEAAETAVAAELDALLLGIPNVIHADAPDGISDADNPVVEMVGDIDGFADHQRVPHWETGAALGILDTERATKITGSMFVMLRGAGATLSRALCQLALDRNADAFEEIRPPSLVSTATLTASGQLPKFADDAYAVERDDLWCIPTAEVPLTSIAAGEILDSAELPMRFMAYSPCYRREAGAAGRDTRGMLRAHEFDKVEILSLATPEQAPAMLDELVHRAEATIATLGLTYRIIEICSGDLGQSHHRSFDIEVYAPGCDMWLEVSSVSWFSDYQARRANIRYRPAPSADDPRPATRMVHTLNGSALAVPRVWAAIVETYRNPDGTVTVPEVLRPYMRGITVIGA
ncbi:MAG: serine--tRNA ligase [Actinobacteria bacterium]|nr:serine--tRNA ligase [Actinomycetota bacterium]